MVIKKRTAFEMFERWVERQNKRTSGLPVSVSGHVDDKHHFTRYAPLWPDESYAVKPDGTRWNTPPWWRPFNVLIHHWQPDDGLQEDFHDHPRWSVTVCLAGRITERTPWVVRELRPGSVVIRSRKAIHRLEMPAGSDEAWTMFIVGRRRFPQNTYVITSQPPPVRTT